MGDVQLRAIAGNGESSGPGLYGDGVHDLDEFRVYYVDPVRTGRRHIHQATVRVGHHSIRAWSNTQRGTHRQWVDIQDAQGRRGVVRDVQMLTVRAQGQDSGVAANNDFVQGGRRCGVNRRDRAGVGIHDKDRRAVRGDGNAPGGVDGPGGEEEDKNGPHHTNDAEQVGRELKSSRAKSQRGTDSA